MIRLGCFDSDLGDASCQAYLKEVEQITRLPLSTIATGLDKVSLEKYLPDTDQSMSVAQVQDGLKSIGFFPGGEIDGICGYRTQSAIRLFQEYVRSVEKADAGLVPDGRFGPRSQAHLKRWMDGDLRSEWTPTIERWRAGTLGQTEYTAWLALLEKVKQRYLASPNRMLEMVNAFGGASGTRKVAQWDFRPLENIHLIGIRRDEFNGKSDDIFVLLIKGLVFKFQESTEPGVMEDAAGYPFLVQGQHDYHFGWHKKTYLALRPQSTVLVVRSKSDNRLDDADLKNGLEANGSINIHWGGRGLGGDVKDWSAGCQVITGSVYIDPEDELIECSRFAAVRSSDPMIDPSKTRGAYNVLVDLVTALSSDQVPTVKYTLLIEPDLEPDPALRQKLVDARNRVMALVT